jgi:ArsR family metal-binding transcriptional regulator
MLIKQYELEVFTPPCDPGAERYSARAHLAVDISAVLPFLNASLEGAYYHPGAPALTWKKGGHNYAFHARQIAVSNIMDRENAAEEIKRLVALVNRTWEGREAITPNFAVRPRPTSMAIHRLLPQTNCRACGEPTCYTFALKLAAGQRTLEDCPPLLQGDRAGTLAELRAIGL